jgi:cobaltochelatase CobN
MSGNVKPIEALIEALDAEGCSATAVFCPSLKETDEHGMPLVIKNWLVDEAGRPTVDVLISTIAFTLAQFEREDLSAFERLGIPVIQAVLSTSSKSEWGASSTGLSPRDLAMSVALPEFDGRMISVAISFKEASEVDEALGVNLARYEPLRDRVRYVAALAKQWAALQRLPNAEKKIAILFGNYPTKNSRIGNGVGLDTPASVMALLRAMQDAGYGVTDLPPSGDQLMQVLIDRCTQDEDCLAPAQLEAAVGTLPDSEYVGAFQRLLAPVREAMERQWGEAPGAYMLNAKGLAIPGLIFGNVFVGIQPSRGFGQDSPAIYHSPDLVPTHFYIGYYQWIRDVFGAHAVIHMGKHGNLEWLPGKGVALSASCYPEVALGALPNIYPYIINNPGEGTQAKRRAHAVIIDHLIPPMTRAETYGDLLKLEQLMDEYYQVSASNPEKRAIVTRRILELVERSQIYRDLKYPALPQETEFDRFLTDVDGYLCQIKESQIRGGLHILGQLPREEALRDLLIALVRVDQAGVQGLPRALAEDLQLDYAALQQDPAHPVRKPIPACFPMLSKDPCRTNADLIERLELLAQRAVTALMADGLREHVILDIVRSCLGQDGVRTCQTLRFLAESVWPRLARTTDEITHVLHALNGRFVPPGPSGAPTRGMATILPTGRNFYSVDIRTIPSESAWEVGCRIGDALLARYRTETGGYPSTVGIVVWGTSNMRTSGDDIAEILYLLGVRPRWQGENRRIIGLEVIPLETLGRPRIDVVVRISGFFRDAFPNVIHLIDDAVRTVAALDEPLEQNFVRAHVLRDQQNLPLALPSAEREAAAERARYRIFGSKPGSYGAGLLNLIDERNWSTDEDLAQVYVAWGGYAYTGQREGIEAFSEFRRQLSGVAVAVQNQDNREHDLFDSDDYFQYHGGMIGAVRALTGKNPTAYYGDSSRPDDVRVRDLKEECARVFRARVVNPKWLRSIMQHGYKGAFEMAATVDYLFGYDATAHVIEDWMYQRLTEAYVLDPEIRAFLNDKNPWALRGMAERLLEAIDRELWESPDPAMQDALRTIYLESDAALEGRSEDTATIQMQSEGDNRA